MKTNIKPISTLHALLDYDAHRFAGAEFLLSKVLPEWVSHTGNIQLKTVCQKYLLYVQEHIEKLNSFFIEEKRISLDFNNRVVQAMIEETKEKLDACSDIEVKDACLLAAVQEINHFKISCYGTAAAFAKALELEKQATLFHEIEMNEKQIDDRLTSLAEHEINIRARAPVALPR